MRLRPRFSLRTLMIAVLLIGSAMTLCFHWEPWVPGLVIPNVVTNASFSPDGRRVLVASVEGAVRVHDAFNGKILVTVARHGYEFEPFAFTPDGRAFLAMRLDSRPTKEWQADDSGKREYVIDYHPSTRVFDAATGSELRTLPLIGLCARPAFSPDGKRLVVMGAKASCQVIDFYSGIALVALKDAVSREGGVFCPRYSPDSKRIAVANGRDNVLRIYDAESGELLLVPKVNYPTFVDFSPDGGRIVTRESGGVVRVWNSFTGAEICEMKESGDSFEGVQFSPDGTRVLAHAAGGYAIFDAQNGHCLVTLQRHGERRLLSSTLFSTTWSPDGNRILISGNGDVVIWEHRRPEQWWGILCLPEFWLTTALASLLPWSLWRDRRAV